MTKEIQEKPIQQARDGMKNCKKCGQQAALHLPSYGVSYCGEHLLEFMKNKVKRIIQKYDCIV
ncbi:MAG: hypothetical protein HWN66_13545 [Candidatus Helarchaeota archaeon]|nr:hypothetical protein [Candidatus Helarchaeota archaeon]